MRIVGAMLLMLSPAAFGGVVLQMPPAPMRPVVAAKPVTPVTALQRFAVGQPAKNSAGQVILQQANSASQVGGGSDWGGYGYGYGWGGYGYGWGGIGCVRVWITPCCRTTTSQVSQRNCGWSGSSMFFGSAGMMRPY
jgi:CubicO group peptidase (beta-lactamase class C family)